MVATLLYKTEPQSKPATTWGQRTFLLVTDGSPEVASGINNAMRMASFTGSRLAIVYFAKEKEAQASGQQKLTQLAQQAQQAGIEEIKPVSEICTQEEKLDDLVKELDAELVILAL